MCPPTTAGKRRSEENRMLTVEPVTPSFVARVTGIDLGQPLQKEALSEISAAIAKYAILVFPGQQLDDEQHLAFSRNFGPLEIAVTSTKVVTDAKQRLASLEIGDVSNLDPDNRPRARTDRRRLHELANRIWHTDSSFKPTPAKYSLLYAHVVPPHGGETEYADLRAGYDALPEATKAEIQDLVCIHHLMHSRRSIGFDDYSPEEEAAFPPVRQRLVRYLPESGRRTLYLASHASHIEDWPVPEGRVLLRDLIEHTTQREFVYRHSWTAGDLVMWDNRCTMHRARPFDERYARDLRRTTVEDVAPSCEQAFLAA
jgi:alpha-ketoglutarate-dependent 2,4-dichlorophenoxyacetate dioxygenase